MRSINFFRTMAVAGAVLLAPSMLSAQLIHKPLSFAVYGGASVPMGDASDAFNTGYTVGGSMDLRAPVAPFGLRAEVGYGSLGMKGVPSGASAKTTDLGGNLNLVTWMPSVIVAPYITAGASYSRLGVTASDGTTSATVTENHFGFNAGAGLDFPLGPIAARVDIRYKQISLGKDENGNSSSIKTVPLTFGIRF